ncbi:hypothetical protein JL721_3638 [Aureococcus anophagefferens]|nr:hypothetical protein JL721_3638 [Aureococcus anophagefferens]
MDVAEAPAAEESLLARLVAAVDIRGVGSLTRAELGEAARLRGPSSKNLDLAAAGPEPYALADAARLLRPLGWEAARLEEDVAKVERARNGKVSWLEFLAGVTSERFGERFASFRDWALETAPLHIFSDIDIDVGVGDEALKELSFLERLPCYVVQATFRKQARRKVRPGDARESDAPATARDLAAIDASVRRALLFGVCCGVGAALLVAYLTPYSLGARRRAHLLLLRLAASLVVSGVEVLLIYACCVDVACAIARRCRLRLWPLDFERALTTAALARAALEIPHPVRPCLGIDPMRHLSGLRLYAVQLLYAGKRGISLFLLKLLLKKVVARVFLKGLGDRAGLDLALVVAVNALWNLLMVAGCVRSAKRRMGRVLEVAGRDVPRSDVARALRHCVAVFTSGLGLCARDLVLAAGADAAGLPRCEAAEPRTADALLGYLAVDCCC